MTEEPLFHIDPEFRGMEKVYLTDQEYTHAIESFVIPCADAILVDRAAGHIYLAKRLSKPMDNTWWMIGGRRKAGVAPRDAMQEIFKRETSLNLPKERFTFAAMAEYLCHNRNQEPQDKGCHTQGYTFALELTAEERAIVAANLDPTEYDPTEGLKAFSVADLSDGSHHPMLRLLAQKALS